MSFKNIILDIEANGLLEDLLDFTKKPLALKESAKIWCVAIRCIDTHQSKVFIPQYILDQIDYFLDRASEEDVAAYKKLPIFPLTKEVLAEHLEGIETFIAHNGIKYDLLALKFFGLIDYQVGYPDLNGINSSFKTKTTINNNPVKIVDTLLLSKLLKPDRVRHGLAYFGSIFGNKKLDFEDFSKFSINMVVYCVQDCSVNEDTYRLLLTEKGDYSGWDIPYLMEAKLADLAVNMELFGFHYDSELSAECKKELDQLLKERDEEVTPQIPPRQANKGELKSYTPPATKFSKSANRISKHMQNFLEKHNADYNPFENTYEAYGKTFDLYNEEPIRTEVDSTIKDLAHIKCYLIELGWEPSEFNNRDLSVDSNKRTRDYDKFVDSLDKYIEETFENNFFKKHRLEILELPQDISPEDFRNHFIAKHLENPKRSIYIPTSPPLRVGTDKKLCPDLIRLAREIPFANALAEYATYSHRRNNISGKEDENGVPHSGYEYHLRADGRISTPVDTLGTNTSRMAHKVVCNVPRPSSLYGGKIRALFGSGPDHYQLGFDFSSLEARIQGHYVYKYDGGPELAEALLREKPFDVHTIRAEQLSIERDDAKAINYAIMYGAQVAKIAKMLKISMEEATILFDQFWDSTPALKELKDNLEEHWKSNDKLFIKAIDGRKLNSRSQHSLLNLLFQGAGSLAVKYTVVLTAQYLEERGYMGRVEEDSYEDSLEKVYAMIIYHDEVQYALPKNQANFKMFDTEDEAKEYVANNNIPTVVEFSEKFQKFYITKENILTDAILDGIDKSIEYLNIKVYLGMEYQVGRTWADCH